MNCLDGNAKAVFQRGSRTFSLAALLFDRGTFVAASRLYAWCRSCDDQVDSETVTDARQAVLSLQAKTQSVFRNEPQEDAAFESLRNLVASHHIPSAPALDLVEGMAMDARGERYETLLDLERYAYHVAGTVGLLMAHIMGVRSREGLAAAVHLGIALQLTNISRDVLEDSRMGRIYLPLEWLREAGIECDPARFSERRAKLAPLAARLVEEADRHYAIGAAGFKYLRWRHAVAIAAAAGMYRAIGLLVVRKGMRAWDERVVVRGMRKVGEILLAPLRAWGIVRLA
jgi:15-cis-phytoene synthase